VRSESEVKDKAFGLLLALNGGLPADLAARVTDVVDTLNWVLGTGPGPNIGGPKTTATSGALHGADDDASEPPPG
jgi:hypothetical protein